MGSTPDGGIPPETRRVTMDEATIVKGYQYAKDIYGRAGVDVDRAIELADRIPDVDAQLAGGRPDRLSTASAS